MQKNFGEKTSGCSKRGHHPHRNNYERGKIEISAFRVSLWWITKAKAKANANLWDFDLLFVSGLLLWLVRANTLITKAHARISGGFDVPFHYESESDKKKETPGSQ